MRYTQYFNERINKKGHLWQGRYFSCVLDEIHLLEAIRYVEMNPVRAGIAESVTEYPWSSARARIEHIEDILVKRYPDVPDNETWYGYLAEPERQEFIDKFRLHTSTGRPLGGDDFVKKIEESTGRRLARKASGRPKGKERRKN